MVRTLYFPSSSFSSSPPTSFASASSTSPSFSPSGASASSTSPSCPSSSGASTGCSPPSSSESGSDPDPSLLIFAPNLIPDFFLLFLRSASTYSLPSQRGREGGRGSKTFGAGENFVCGRRSLVHVPTVASPRKTGGDKAVSVFNHHKIRLRGWI